MSSASTWWGGRWPLLLAAVLSGAAVFAVWGSLSPVPVMHDEWAYWLQADQYSHFRWSMPAPRYPEFFEQFYVLVSPVFAAKYPPGHALAMAPGFMVGLPALMPLLFTAATGALLFALARRAAGAGVAALTWALWLSTFGNLRFRAAFFSETTTSLCWLLAWWALLEWRSHAGARRTRWMVLLAATIGWGAITRPATMFVFAIPVGAIVLRDVAVGRRWRELVIGAAAGAAVLAVLPVWSAQVTGSWRESPLARYTRQYLPFDVPGYRMSDVKPERSLPLEMERTRSFLRDIKTEQATAPAYRTLMDRGGFLLRDAFGDWRLPFGLALLIGLGGLGASAWFALGTSVLLLIAYGTQAHTADWTVYYLEAMPVLAFAAASGALRLWTRMGGTRAPRLVVPLLCALIGVLLVRDIVRTRVTLDRIAETPRRFRAAVAMLPKAPHVVFVRYAERRSMHIALVANDGLLTAARSWIVHDRGAANLRLLEAAPGRAAYLFDESTGEFREMSR